MKCIETPNKKRYSTKRDAETAALLIGNNIRTYYCLACRGWHLTSKPVRE